MVGRLVASILQITRWICFTENFMGLLIIIKLSQLVNKLCQQKKPILITPRQTMGKFNCSNSTHKKFYRKIFVYRFTFAIRQKEFRLKKQISQLKKILTVILPKISNFY